MSISELMHRPERARRMEVFTGAGRRRNWPADERAAIVAESYAPGRTVCGVARRHGLTPAQLFTWRRLARRARLPVKEPPVRFVPAVVEASPRVKSFGHAALTHSTDQYGLHPAHLHLKSS
jgi:transposase